MLKLLGPVDTVLTKPDFVTGNYPPCGPAWASRQATAVLDSSFISGIEVDRCTQLDAGRDDAVAVVRPYVCDD